MDLIETWRQALRLAVAFRDPSGLLAMDLPTVRCGLRTRCESVGFRRGVVRKRRGRQPF